MAESTSFVQKRGLKKRTISGLFWSFTENIANQLVHFVVGIILARILSPSEFGLIGMITIFIAVSQSFIDSGFQQALIRKKDASNTDFSTVFYFNFLVGVAFYILLFLSAGRISRFYHEPQLNMILKIFGLILIINAVALIQRVRLIKDLNFKLQTKISFTSSLLSGFVGIYMAYNGFGVWSLVWRTLINNLLQTIFLWIFNKWIPKFVFSKKSFNEMFSFGSRLLVSGLIDTIYKNIYLLIIGKYFSAAELGYFTRADQFKKLASNNITSTIQKVSYPALSIIQDNEVKLKEGYRKIIKTTMFITFTAMLVMSAIAKTMILTLIGEKWLPSVIYLQLLAFAGMLYPLHAINLNMLNIKGRSDLVLRLEIIKKTLAIPVVIIGILTSIKIMIIGMIFNSFFGYYLNSYYSGRLINYSVMEQINDIFPSFLIALIVAIAVFIPSIVINFSPMIMMLFQIIMAIIMVITISEILQLDSYLMIKNIITDKLNTKFKKSD